MSSKQGGVGKDQAFLKDRPGRHMKGGLEGAGRPARKPPYQFRQVSWLPGQAGGQEWRAGADKRC